MKCSYCNSEIIGLPLFGRDGKPYCSNHIIPESRGERGKSVYKNVPYSVIYHSDGSISTRSRKPKKTKPKSTKKSRRSK